MPEIQNFPQDSLLEFSLTLVGIPTFPIIKVSKNRTLLFGLCYMAVSSQHIEQNISSPKSRMTHGESSKLSSSLFPTYKQNLTRLSILLCASTVYSGNYQCWAAFTLSLTHNISICLLLLWNALPPSLESTFLLYFITNITSCGLQIP